MSDQSDIDDEWLKFSRDHVLPSRLFAIATGLDEATTWERQHLQDCDRCRHWLAQYNSQE